MGASGISIQWAIGAVLLLSVIALFISPFSAIFVLAAGVMVIVFIAVWGRRAAEGEVEGETDEREGADGSPAPTVPRAKGAER